MIFQSKIAEYCIIAILNHKFTKIYDFSQKSMDSPRFFDKNAKNSIFIS